MKLRRTCQRFGWVNVKKCVVDISEKNFDKQKRLLHRKLNINVGNKISKWCVESGRGLLSSTRDRTRVGGFCTSGCVKSTRVFLKTEHMCEEYKIYTHLYGF